MDDACRLGLLTPPGGPVSMVLDTDTANEIDDHFARRGPTSHPLWDLSAVAWLVNPAWVGTDIVHAPRLTDQLTWSADQRRQLMRVARRCERAPILDDLCARLDAHAAGRRGSDMP